MKLVQKSTEVLSTVGKQACLMSDDFSTVRDAAEKLNDVTKSVTMDGLFSNFTGNEELSKLAGKDWLEDKTSLQNGVRKARSHSDRILTLSRHHSDEILTSQCCDCEELNCDKNCSFAEDIKRSRHSVGRSSRSGSKSPPCVCQRRVLNGGVSPRDESDHVTTCSCHVTSCEDAGVSGYRSRSQTPTRLATLYHKTETKLRKDHLPTWDIIDTDR